MKRCALAGLLFLLSVPVWGASEGIDENELFSTPDVIAPPVAGAVPETEKTGTTFSAELLSVMEGVGLSTATKSSMNSFIVGNAFIDARLKNDLKAFANIETNYTPQTRATTLDLRELFFDFNFEHRVYFRTGKQVLQWGRCYLWNPTDLVNIEKKSFIRKIGYREGGYGLKMHVPFGAQRNIYAFLDVGNAPSPDDVGGAVKYEFLAGKTEMAFSGWTKSSYNPVLGYDFSSRLGVVDILGELSVSKGENSRRLLLNQGVLSVYRNDEDWNPRTSINFSRGFRLGNFNDRLTVATEFFYNHAGYEENIFADRGVYAFAAPLIVRDASGAPVVVSGGTKKDFLLANSLYDPNYFSKYYGALFATVTRFLLTDMTLSANYIRNFNDGSGILSTGVTYRNINDFTTSLLINTFLGSPNGEYTFSATSYDVQLTCGIVF